MSQVNEVSDEVVEGTAEAELLRLQREKSEHSKEAAQSARAALAKAQAGPVQPVEPEAQEVGFLWPCTMVEDRHILKELS